MLYYPKYCQKANLNIPPVLIFFRHKELMKVEVVTIILAVFKMNDWRGWDMHTNVDLKLNTFFYYWAKMTGVLGLKCIFIVVLYIRHDYTIVSKMNNQSNWLNEFRFVWSIQIVFLWIIWYQTVSQMFNELFRRQQYAIFCACAVISESPRGH